MPAYRVAASASPANMPIAASLLPRLGKEAIGSTRRLAREEFGREVGIWTQGPVVQRETRQEAEEFLNYFAVQHEDRATVDAWVARNRQGIAHLKNDRRRISRVLLLPSGGNPMVGSATDVADQLEALSELGIDGILLSWFDFENGLKKFSETVLPILEQRGLRAPFRPS